MYGAEKLPWFHQIDLGGYVTPGVADIGYLRAQADIYFKNIQGKSVLDIGCWDGFNSFEAEKRGASRVLATDHFAWTPPCWGDRRSFELAHQVLKSRVEVRDLDLPDIRPQVVGTFDVVLFLGIFYHLRNPFLTLEQIAPVCTDTLIVETHIDALDNPKPVMVFYPTDEVNGDASNWWGPNPACVSAMLRDLGFQPQYIPHPRNPTRGIFFGVRK